MFSNANDHINRSEYVDSENVLPDLLDRGLDIVFCGTAVGKKSASVGAYYSGRGNKFWKVLYAVGLTPVQLRADQYRELLNYKIGLTDLAKNVSGNDTELLSNDFDVEYLKAKITKYNPKMLAFNGKKGAKIYLSINKVDYGLCRDIKIGKTEIYVLPSTSGSANRSWDIDYWASIANKVTLPRFDGH